MSKLQKGDVFNVVKGMEIYAAIPYRYLYENTPFSDKKTHTDVKVGEILTVQGGAYSQKGIAEEIIEMIQSYSSFEGVKIDKKKLMEAIGVANPSREKYPTAYLIGEYVVIHANEINNGPRNPSGWFIQAKQLKNGKYDPKGETISFYQDRGFTAVNEYVPVERKMKPTFV